MPSVIEPDLSRLPATIAEIRELLPETDRKRFAAELDAVPCAAVPDLLERWGMYAIGLHDRTYQEALAHIHAGHPERIETIPANIAHAQLRL